MRNASLCTLLLLTAGVCGAQSLAPADTQSAPTSVPKKPVIFDLNARRLLAQLFGQPVDQDLFRQGKYIFGLECFKKKGDHPMCVPHPDDLHCGRGFK